MILASLLLAAATVLPADRLAMADRLFNRGQYAAARAEYDALGKEGKIAADEIMYRQAECDRATGKTASARELYSTLVLKYPESAHVSSARFLYAMGAAPKDRVALLRALDSDRVDKETRAAALYNIGIETGSVDALEKCISIDPSGKYVPYANLRRGVILSGSAVSAERRQGISILLDLAFEKGPLADEALYLAALQSYRGKKYDESASLFRRYRKNHPDGPHADEARVMIAWSDFLDGHYADAITDCGEGKDDDTAYILAASAYATGEKEKALGLFKKYLETYPQGKYRADAELPIARIEFDNAEKEQNASKSIETARRGFGLSKLAADELRLAWAYEKAGKQAEAKDEYTRIAQNFPKSDEAAEALYRKALIAARAEEWSAAELTLAEALATEKLGTFKGTALYWRGIAALHLGHETEAIGFLKEAMMAGLTLDESREARLMIADADARAGRTDEAKKAYVQLVKEGACERMSSARMRAVGKLVGGETAKICARALTKLDAPEWRQAGWTLLGEVEEKEKSYSAAIEAYRKAMAEHVITEEKASAAYHLGLLEEKAGEREAADATLKKAIELNAEHPRERAEAYLALARNAQAMGDVETARAYATVVTSLFDDEKLIKEANRILSSLDQAEKK